MDGWEIKNMVKNKSQLTTIVLLIMTFCLLGATGYISFLLTAGDEGKSKIVPIKTKAADITYSKLVTFNTTDVGMIPTEVPTEIPTPTVEEMVSPAEAQETPTPTEIILAYNNLEVTEEATGEAELSTTLSPTKVQNLPDAGFIYNGLIIFAAAILMVFFSFLF